MSESDRCGSPFLRLIRGMTVGKLTARLSVCRTKRLNDELTLACGVFAELLRCVACVNCGVTAYINSKLCVLKRVESISESPGSVRQLNESRFGRNSLFNCKYMQHATNCMAKCVHPGTVVKSKKKSFSLLTCHGLH